MINYVPLKSCAPWKNVDHADLISFDWQRKLAVFAYGSENKLLEVSFDGHPVIVRMLDELAISTEGDGSRVSGVVPHHFAYRVEGDPFFYAQSEIWRMTVGNPRHYRFFTGEGCLDVISDVEPQFSLAGR